MSKKTERALNGPSWIEVILGAALSLVLGVALAAAFLVLKPVETVKELPKAPVAGVVYYLEGSRDANKGRQAAAKEKIFLRGGSVVLNEDELNVLATPNVSAPPPPKPGPKGKAAAPAPAPVEPPADKALTAGAPNFRVRSNVLQIGVPLRLSALGFDQRMVVQARGGFVKDGDAFVFAPDEIYLGSCPLHRLPLVSGYLMRRFISASAVSDDLTAAWQKLGNVVVVGSTLRLTVQ